MPANGQRPYHHGDLRRSLIQAGSKLIDEKGIVGLSLREVAKAVGVSHAAPYRHFKDKEDLLAAVAQVGFEQLTDEAVKAAQGYACDPKKQLVELSERYILFFVRRPRTAHLLFGGVINMRTAPRALKQASWNAFQLVETIINNGKTTGVFRNRDTMDLAVTIWSGIHGLAQLISGGYLTPLATTPTQVKALGKMVCQLLLTGILQSDSQPDETTDGCVGHRPSDYENRD